MSFSTEIINTALIGCERKSLSLGRSADKLGKLLAQLDRNDRENTLLGAAALVLLYERAGSLALKDTQPLPEKCVPEAAERCSERAKIHLAMMLRGEYQRLLPEWLAALSGAGKRVPEECLPLLLELGRSREELRDAILAVLGARGNWLAAQNSNWEFASGRFDETLWETGSSEQRRRVLAELRKRDPARARDLLKSTWAQESPKDRADFLTVFENGLSLEDEEFLEFALDDRRKEVRRSAADLLARLPGSALRSRMLERARPLLIFKLNRLKRKTIEVTLPEACDKAMQRDGIEPKPYSPNSKDVGEKAWWLQQMLGLIPPNVWVQDSGWSIDELITVAKRGEWKRILLDGWTRASQYCRDIEWADTLLTETDNQEHALTLFQVLPQPRQESFIIELLRTTPSLALDKPGRGYVASCTRPWSVKLSQMVVNSLLHQAATDRFKDGWMWSEFTDNIGCRLDPALIPETISRLTEATMPAADRPGVVEQFLNFIQFRYEMLKEIDK